MTLQHIHKIKNKFNIKNRRRKYKLRVLNKNVVPSASYARTVPHRPSLAGVRLDNACRVRFETFIGSEKSIMATKNKVRLHYIAYPNFFVTRKSSKSRMGKGKGKIAGRVLRIHKGETIFNLRFFNYFKSRKWIKALRSTLPSTSKIVYASHSAFKFKSNFYINRSWIGHKRKKRKRPFWMKTKVVIIRRTKTIRFFYTPPFPWRAYLRSTRLVMKRDNLHMLYKMASFIRSSLSRASRRWIVSWSKSSQSAYHKKRGKRNKFFKSSCYSFHSPRIKGGGISRSLLFRGRMGASYIKRLYEAYISTDAEGYIGLSKHTNKMMKRTRAYGRGATFKIKW